MTLKIVDPQTVLNRPSSPRAPYAQRRAGELRNGIEVREEELGFVKAQRLYSMRCECGRSWFELDLPKLVQCPACAKLCAVFLEEPTG